MSDPQHNDWLSRGPGGMPGYQQPDAWSQAAPASSLPPNRRRRWQGAGLVAAGVVAGGVLAGALSASASSGTTAAGTTAAITSPAASSTAASGANSSGASSSSSTATDTETNEVHGGHGLDLSGTVSAVTSNSVTIKTASGTKTYAVNSASDIDKNGEATVASLVTGDAVTFSTTASGGTTIDKLHAGNEALDHPSAESGTPAG